MPKLIKLIISDLDNTLIIQKDIKGTNKRVDQYATKTDEKISKAIKDGAEAIFLSTMTIDEIKTSAGEDKILRTDIEKKYSKDKEQYPKIIPGSDLFFASLGATYLELFKPLYEKIATKIIDPLNVNVDYKKQVGEPGARDVYHRVLGNVMKKLLSAMAQKEPIFKDENDKKNFIKTAITDLKSELKEFTPEGTYLTAIEDLEVFLTNWDKNYQNHEEFLTDFISNLNNNKLVDLTFIRFIQENLPLFSKHKFPLNSIPQFLVAA